MLVKEKREQMLKGNSMSRGVGRVGSPTPMSSLTMRPPIVSPMSGGNSLSLNPPPPEPKPTPPSFPPPLGTTLPDPSPFGSGGMGSIGGTANTQKPMGLQRLMGARQPGLL